MLRSISSLLRPLSTVVSEGATNTFSRGISVSALAQQQKGGYVWNQPVKTQKELAEMSEEERDFYEALEDLKKFEHAAGRQRNILIWDDKGYDLFKEEWLYTPYFGTIDRPVVVTSYYNERIVGVTDPEDDCHTWWATLRVGDPPKQIFEGGEFFLLKQIQPPDFLQFHH
eukprot:TRINITY_DN74140_c0_g1_i2.p4 TRINITY_DN74140_c0_g1~~TRINITY_DN74140_c0_g1_i2.p4  ORF type:complete len:170 (-),score=30.04 TRINITY_DN74140_c0_g1_i2:235-744(-)